MLNSSISEKALVDHTGVYADTNKPNAVEAAFV